MASHESHAFKKQLQEGETSEKRIKPLREIPRDDRFGGNLLRACEAWNKIREDASVNDNHYWNSLPQDKRNQYVDSLQRCENSHGEFIDAGIIKDIQYTREAQEVDGRKQRQFIENSNELTNLHEEIKTILKEIEHDNIVKRIQQLQQYITDQERKLLGPSNLLRHRQRNRSKNLTECMNKESEAVNIEQQIKAWQMYGNIQQQDLSSLVKQYEKQISNTKNELADLSHKYRNNITHF